MTVSNKTHKPLSLPLPGGKILHLGPGKTGQITAKAAEDPRLKKLVEAGEIEIFPEEDSRRAGGSAGPNKYRSAAHRQTPGSHRSGDR